MHTMEILYQKDKKEHGHGFPHGSHFTTIKEETKIDAKTLQYTLKNLQQKELIIRIKEKGSRPVYQLTFDSILYFQHMNRLDKIKNLYVNFPNYREKIIDFMDELDNTLVTDFESYTDELVLTPGENPVITEITLEENINHHYCYKCEDYGPLLFVMGYNQTGYCLDCTKDALIDLEDKLVERNKTDSQNKTGLNLLHLLQEVMKKIEDDL